MTGAPLPRPRAVAFDIVGTVFPLDPLRPLLTTRGLPATALDVWFASALRDAFALAAVDRFRPFAEVLRAALVAVSGELGAPVSDAEAGAVVERVATLPARADAREAFGRLRAAGLPLLAVSNGAAETTRAMLAGAGLDGFVEHVVSVDEVRLSKPRREVYAHAAAVAGVEPGALMLVAAHAWDVNGAAAAGFRTAYLSADRPFSPIMTPPDLQAASLAAIAGRIASC